MDIDSLHQHETLQRSIPNTSLHNTSPERQHTSNEAKRISFAAEDDDESQLIFGHFPKPITNNSTFPISNTTEINAETKDPLIVPSNDHIHDAAVGFTSRSRSHAHKYRPLTTSEVFSPTTKHVNDISALYQLSQSLPHQFVMRKSNRKSTRFDHDVLRDINRDLALTRESTIRMDLQMKSCTDVSSIVESPSLNDSVSESVGYGDAVDAVDDNVESNDGSDVETALDGLLSDLRWDVESISDAASTTTRAETLVTEYTFADRRSLASLNSAFTFGDGIDENEDNIRKASLVSLPQSAEDLALKTLHGSEDKETRNAHLSKIGEDAIYSASFLQSDYTRLLQSWLQIEAKGKQDGDVGRNHSQNRNHAHVSHADNMMLQEQNTEDEMDMTKVFEKIRSLRKNSNQEAVIEAGALSIVPESPKTSSPWSVSFSSSQTTPEMKQKSYSFNRSSVHSASNQSIHHFWDNIIKSPDSPSPQSAFRPMNQSFQSNTLDSASGRIDSPIEQKAKASPLQTPTVARLAEVAQRSRKDSVSRALEVLNRQHRVNLAQKSGVWSPVLLHECLPQSQDQTYAHHSFDGSSVWNLRSDVTDTQSESNVFASLEDLQQFLDAGIKRSLAPKENVTMLQTQSSLQSTSQDASINLEEENHDAVYGEQSLEKRNSTGNQSTFFSFVLQPYLHESSLFFTPLKYESSKGCNSGSIGKHSWFNRIPAGASIVPCTNSNRSNHLNSWTDYFTKANSNSQPSSIADKKASKPVPAHKIERMIEKFDTYLIKRSRTMQGCRKQRTNILNENRVEIETLLRFCARQLVPVCRRLNQYKLARAECFIRVENYSLQKIEEQLNKMRECLAHRSQRYTYRDHKDPGALLNSDPFVKSSVQTIKYLDAKVNELERVWLMIRKTVLAMPQEMRIKQMRYIIQQTSHQKDICFHEEDSKLQEMFNKCILDERTPEGRKLRRLFDYLQDKGKDDISPEEVVGFLEEFLNTFLKEFNIEDETQQSIMRLYLNRAVFPRLLSFCRRFETPDDIQSDKKLCANLRSMRNLPISSMEIDLKFFESEQVAMETVECAADMLSDLGFYCVPSDMLNCISRTARLIVQRSTTKGKLRGGMSADDFVPIFIYCVSRAEIPNVHRCINFMNNFSSDSNMKSELGWGLTTFTAAVHHLTEANDTRSETTGSIV
eukprot:TRINITY_DN4137_c0_g1_i12.p1 TRINITY_DN4137_c0_g1~~TRINITY_DN4137_c0_g1_i12.p1  ORF type:complete len:1176 (+),score=249.60 TRINITY_DN4137_c0_g1_i12:42-3569(+)